MALMAFAKAVATPVPGDVKASAVSVPPVLTFSVEPSVPANVRVLLEVSVLPSASVNVAPVAGAVNVNLLIVPGNVSTEGRESVGVAVFPSDVI